MTLINSYRDLVLELYRSKCIIFGDFILTSGLKSPFYVDLRIIPSLPNLFKKVIDAYNSTIKKINYDVMVGIAVASIPISSVLAYLNNKPLIYVRREAKHHGTMRIVEGTVEKGLNAIVIDDVATTGSSIINAINATNKFNLHIKYAVVFVDREHGAADKLERHGVKLISILKISDIFKILYDEGMIDNSLYIKVMRYVGDIKG